VAALKEELLRRQRLLHTRPQDVRDPLFQESEFFDPRDLLLVRYEMLRKVRVEHCSVSEAARQFGFSRPTYYELLAAWESGGLPALLPQHPGPRGAHKLTDEIVTFLEAQHEGGVVRALELAERLYQERNVRLHPRSIERALRGKKRQA
jgi:transposase